MPPTFDSLDETTGFEVVDPIETRRFTFSTPTPVEPTPADPDSFRFPVSSACTVETDALDLPYAVLIYVRNREGDLLADLDYDATAEFPPGEYLLEFSASIKLYLRAEAGVTVESEADSTRIAFDRTAEVEVGARSFHESSAATVTTTDDPEDVMAAVSTFGSGLKATGPERSWPTLRGHPPLVERGDELAIPDDLDAPDTGVTVEIPPTLDAVYPVAPLAYYLGAEVVPGETPRLTVGGFEHRLDGDAGFEEEVVRTLRQVFFLDCVARTEGLYPVELIDRDRVESLTDLDLGALYDAGLAEQLEAYLSVPYSTLADAMPTWHRVAFVRPDPENVEVLPHLVDDLSVVRTPPRRTYEETDEKRAAREALSAFKRSPRRDATGSEPAASGSAAERRGVPPLGDYVDTPDVDALEVAWAGDGTPVRGTKVLPEAFRHESAATTGDAIDITVVCNDDEMREEWDAVAEVYASRETISFDPSVHFEVTTDELRDLLRRPTDILHYVGHVDGRGFECADGSLDARDLDSVGTRAFLLNACRSYDQGVALVEAGSHGGVVSLGNVGNPAAVEFGETLAKLFRAGFSIGSALAITRRTTFVGSRYIALGDPGFTVSQSDDVVPLLFVVTGREAGQITMRARGYPTRDHGIGSISTTYFDDGPKFLSTGPYRVHTTEDRMTDLRRDAPFTPLIVDEELVLAREWWDSN